jgi:hypothetical protein
MTLQIPDTISKAARHAAEAIILYLELIDGTTGGCRAFYSPTEWLERGEEYGHDAELIVVHDGGDLAPAFNLDYGAYDSFDSMARRLANVGVTAEACTCWYTAIYSTENRP